jgi:phenylpropionate dioxygenase-like ring-hydroxylating dioxygenase large terminal subunit
MDSMNARGDFQLHEMVKSDDYTSSEWWSPERQPSQVLPIEAYTSQEWFERERKQLFGRTWNFVGMVEDVKELGDYITVQCGDASIVVLRDMEGRLRAFHNVCRHRGSRLLEGSGNIQSGLISCFYHRWGYNLQGELQLTAVPFQKDLFPCLDKTQFSLHHAKVGVWKNLLFVHPDPTAMPLDHWMSKVDDQLGPFMPEQTRLHEPEELVEALHIVYRVRANWKIISENFFDGYHLPILHTVSLGDGDFAHQKWRPASPHMVFYRPIKPEYSKDVSYAERYGPMPVIDGIPPNYGMSYQWLFPNVGLAQTAYTWSTFHVIPVSASESLVSHRSRGIKTADMTEITVLDAGDLPSYMVSAKGFDVSPERFRITEHPLESNNVTQEDIYACERVQEGLSSRKASVGPLSKWELPLSFFQTQVQDYVPQQ